MPGGCGCENHGQVVRYDGILYLRYFCCHINTYVWYKLPNQ